MTTEFETLRPECEESLPLYRAFVRDSYVIHREPSVNPSYTVNQV
jgi:hypothetical protein